MELPSQHQGKSQKEGALVSFTRIGGCRRTWPDLAGCPIQKELKTTAALLSQTPLISQAGKLPAWSGPGKCTVEGTLGKREQGRGWEGKSLWL